MPPTHDIPSALGRPARWVVITGAPCSGKTSVIEALERRGHRVVHEVARAYIDSQLSAGLSLKRIKSDILKFERHILEAKVAIERRLPRDQLIFFDRAVPDSFAYYRLEGLSGREAFEKSRDVKYRRVFLFERLMFERDSVRTEDQALAGRIEALLVQGYEALGYDITRVPLMSIEERVAFVLGQTADG